MVVQAVGSEGQDHIALTMDILWQIWKARNETEFEDKDRHPLEAIQKAIKDWEEYHQSQQTVNQVSISRNRNSSRTRAEEGNMLNICVDVGQHKEGQNMGIGITPKNNFNQLFATWKLKDRSTGTIVLHYLQAMKLALCKTKEQDWQLTKIQILDTQALNLIRKQGSSNKVNGRASRRKAG